MWMRACPLCGTELMKAALDFRTDCACGWTWQGDPHRELELAATGDVAYVDSECNLAQAAMLPAQVGWARPQTVPL